MNLIVIEEIDKDEKSTIIGVAENMDYAKEMLHDYNGKYKLLGVEDVRESGIEYVYNIEVDKEELTIVFRDFNLNSI